MEPEKMYLHAVIVDKSVGLVDAKKIARKIMEKSRLGMYRVDEESFRFRNIPKNKFKYDSFRSKKINDTTTLVFGHLREI